MKIRSDYTKQLKRLDAHIGVLAQGVVDDIRATADAFTNNDSERLQEVIEGHRAAEHLHKTVEDSCMNIMLLQQPLASDLRLVTAAFRAVSDLARIDEMAYEIALLTKEMELELTQSLEDHLSEMALRAANMVDTATRAFEQSDVARAEDVFPQDNAIDNLYETTRREVVDLLKNDAEGAAVAPEVLSMAKYYERMGDHAQSIADWAIFRATGTYRGRSMGEVN